MNDMFKTVISCVIVGGMTILSIAAMTTNYNAAPWIASLFQPKLLDGHKLFNTNHENDLAMAEIFNEDNGVYYCVPKLSNREVVELRTAMASRMVTAAFSGIDNPALLQQLTTMPLQTMMRESLKNHYPCY